MAEPRRLTPKLLGDTEVTPRRPVGLGVADARHHTHVMGKTGVGKSTLLCRLALADIAAGRGTIVVDPKGDLVSDLLARIPEDRIRDVVVIDPAEEAAPVALNVLAGSNPHLVTDQVVGVFARVFAAWWGPRTDDVFRAACLTLLRRSDATLADVPRLLTDARLRAPLVAGCTEPLAGFWSWYEELSAAGRAQAISPLMNKLRAVLSRPFAADLFGSARSSFDMAAVLDGGVLLVRVPKGLVGDDTARLVGSLVVAQVWQAATARSAEPEDHRLDASVYIDECQNFLHLPGAIEDVLAEARGYRLAVTLAHQHLGQLPRDLAQTVAANARNKLFFVCSPEDARVLARHVGPHLSADDLARLDGYQVAVRLVVDGRELSGFTLRTRPLPPPIPGRAEALRGASRAAYGLSHAARRHEALRRNRRCDGAGVLAYASPTVSPYASVCAPDAQGSPAENTHVDGADTPARRDPDSWIDS